MSEVPDLLSIISAAKEWNADPGSMSRLIDSYEREREEARVAAYNKAMRDAQAKMPTVVRDSLNKQTSSKYAKLETIQEHIKPIYSECGFALSFFETASHIPDHKRIEVEIMHEAGHSKKLGIDLALDTLGMKGNPSKTPIQGEISTMSYARRILLTMVFDIVIADKDDDGQSSGFLTSDQVEHLNSLIHKWSPPTDQWNGFLIWACKPKISELPRSEFGRVRDMLASRVSNKGITAAGAPATGR